jgi:hypothetical protein
VSVQVGHATTQFLPKPKRQSHFNIWVGRIKMSTTCRGFSEGLGDCAARFYFSYSESQVICAPAACFLLDKEFELWPT